MGALVVRAGFGGYFYRVLKGGWFKGGGYKGSLRNLKGTLGSTGENSGLVGYLPLP